MNKEQLISIIKPQLDRLGVVCDSQCNAKLYEMTIDQLLFLAKWLITLHRKWYGNNR